MLINVAPHVLLRGNTPLYVIKVFSASGNTIWTPERRRHAANLYNHLQHSDDNFNHCPSFEEPVRACKLANISYDMLYFIVVGLLARCVIVAS